jgi:hypothetical protein
MTTLSHISSEAVVFYNAPVQQGHAQLNENIVRASQRGYLERYFLDYLDYAQFFVFCQATHASAEVLGKPDPIMRYLERAKSVSTTM